MCPISISWCSNPAAIREQFSQLSCLAAAATSRIFATKVGVLPERVFVTMLNDRLVAKGTILAFFTALVKDFLETEKVEDLAQILAKAKMEERLVEYFPPSKRTEGDLEKHFKVWAQAVGCVMHCAVLSCRCCAFAEKGHFSQLLGALVFSMCGRCCFLSLLSLEYHVEAALVPAVRLILFSHTVRNLAWPVAGMDVNRLFATDMAIYKSS